MSLTWVLSITTPKVQVIVNINMCKSQEGSYTYSLKSGIDLYALITPSVSAHTNIILNISLTLITLNINIFVNIYYGAFTHATF